MANSLENAMARTRVLAGMAKARGLDDRQLLYQFADGDESAFTILVERHGGLVMGVCRRVLQHTQDAEDAFQATFMVLARKAGKVAWQESIANWLHGVACRIAFQVRREKARRRIQGNPVDEPAVNGPDPAWSELKPLLDEELDRLPARYRIPLVLCCLEGKSRDEAAAQLGWSIGSLKGRLERGRELLRSRLARRGLALSTALASLLVIGGSAKAAVPLTLGLETVRAGMAMLAGQTTLVSTPVLTLAQGALHAMFMTKVKFAAAIAIAVITLGLGSGYVTHQVLAGGRNPDPSVNQRTGDAGAVGQREGTKETPSVSGFVKEASADKITIIVGRDNLDGQTLDVAKDAKVVIREGRETKAGKLADLQPRTQVTLLLDDAKKIVQTIEVQVRGADGERGGREVGNFHTGVVTEIDAAKKTITFQAGGRGEAPTTQTFDLAKDVKVVFRTGRNTKEGKLADVPLKTVIKAKLDDTKKIVQAIEVAISTTASGTVSEISADSITLTVGGGRGGDEGKSTTYALSKDLKIQYRVPGGTGERGRGEANVTQGKLADVVLKSAVTLQLDDELKVVQAINVNLATLNGAVQSVDAKKLTLLLRPARGDDVQLDIAKDAKVMVNGKAGTLDGVAVGAEVHVVLSPDRTRVLFLQTPPAAGREE